MTLTLILTVIDALSDPSVKPTLTLILLTLNLKPNSPNARASHLNLVLDSCILSVGVALRVGWSWGYGLVLYTSSSITTLTANPNRDQNPNVLPEKLRGLPTGGGEAEVIMAVLGQVTDCGLELSMQVGLAIKHPVLVPSTGNLVT